MKTIVFLLACCVILPVQAEVFRWVDKEGAVHYGDAPPKDSGGVEHKKLARDPAQEVELSPEARIAQQNFPVVLYVTKSCGGPCSHGRALLSKRGIPYREKVLQNKEEIDALRALSSFDTAPILAVGANYMEGVLEEQWNDELDAAGYPKTAPVAKRKEHAPAAPAATDRSHFVPPSPE